MGDQRNYAALEWVLGEIEETLKDARQALESYVENQKDTTQLRFCVTHIHQVRGSLQIVEFNGASLLAEEMEQLAQDLVDRKIKKPDEAHEVLMQALLQLPIYLDHVRVYREDSPRSIMPLLNDLRAVRNKNYLTETNLFNPDLSQLGEVSGRQHPVLNDTEKVKQVAGKLREMYQFAAASVLRKIKVSENLDYLEKVFARLISLTSGTRSAPLWSVSAALIEAIKHEDVEISVAVQGLLRHLARELRILSEQAPGAFDTTPREDLIKNLLYYVYSSKGRTPLVESVRKQFGLDRDDDSQKAAPVDGYTVSALDPEAVRSVVIALREELKSIKSILDNILIDQQSPSELSEVQPVVKRVADTLAVLGISELRQKMLLQADQLEELSKRTNLDETTISDSVQHIIDVDAKLEAISKSVDNHRDLTDVNEQKIEITEAKLAVIRECQIGLEKAKEAIIEYISSQWDASHLEDIDALLRDIRGGMDIVPLPRASAIVDACSRFIVENLMVEQHVEPSWETLEHLADAMASVEYFLERLAKDMNEESGSLLDIAEESLTKLGYGFGDDSEPVVEPEAAYDHQVPTEATELVEEHPESDVTAFSAVHAEASAEETYDENLEGSFLSGEDVESDVDEEIIEVFIEEAQEVRETLNEYVPKWIQDSADEENLSVVRRAFHTLKGSGRMVEAMDIGELAWSIENMLNRVIDSTVEFKSEHGRIVNSVMSVLPAMIAAFEAKKRFSDLDTVEKLSRWAFSLADGVVPSDFEDVTLQQLAHDAQEQEKHAEIQAESPVEHASDDAAVGALDEHSEFAVSEQHEPEAQSNADSVDEHSDFEADEPEDYALLEIFISEAETHLTVIRSFIADMDERAPIYTAPTDELQRALHTLKGSAKMAQVVPMGKIYEALENFAKEMVTFQVTVDDDVLQLIRDSVFYGENVISQIKNRESVHVDQLEQFLARTAELREISVGHLVRMKEQEKDGEKPVDPRLLSIFMAEEMTLLLDAEEIVDSWCNSVESETRIPQLVSELNTLSEGAEQAKLPDMSAFALKLANIYSTLLNHTHLVDDDARLHLKAGHEALLDMVDAVAAGQNVQPPKADLIEQIDHYVDALNIKIANIDNSFSESEPSNLSALDEMSNQGVVLDTPEDDSSTNAFESVAEAPIEEAPIEDALTAETLLAATQPNDIDSENTTHSAFVDEPALDSQNEQAETEEPAFESQIHGEVDAGYIDQPMVIGEGSESQSDDAEYEARDESDTDTSESNDERVFEDAFEDSVEKFLEEPASAEETESLQQGGAAQPQFKLLDEIDTESDDFDVDILEVFIEESDELVESLDESIHSWESDQDFAQVEEMKRALHTMKGGARLSGLPVLGDLVHDYESFLIETSPENASESAFAKVHEFQDRMLYGLNAVKEFLGQPVNSSVVNTDFAFADSSSHSDESAAASESDDESSAQKTEGPSDASESNASENKSFPVFEPVDGDEGGSAASNVLPFGGKAKPGVPDLPSDGDQVTGSGNVTPMPQTKKSGSQEVVRVNSDLLEELVNLAGETSISRARLEEQVGEFKSSLDEVDSTIQRLQEQLRRLDIETEAQILFRQEQMAVHEESFDPLEMDRYSQLQQLSRSLIESASDLNDLRSDLSDKLRDTETTLLQQSRVNTTLQEGLMRSRMVPFSRMVPRLRRIVRQVATELGKKVSFDLDNVEGELDRSVLERMIPPFEHMLRNAVDHGIESPEERVNAGKPESGRIVLTLAREGGNVSIRLADDGRGIDLQRVRNKAIERGLMDADADLSDHDVMQFILHAGFSTAENVTQISGRGVGMDVVHSEIKQLGGDVMINSEQGRGTEFVIHLPFTLSVNRALMVNIGQDQYAIPLNSIEGIVRISPFELEHYYSNPESEFEYANDHYKVRYLGNLLYAGRKANLEGQVLPMPIVLVRTAQHTMALQVDGLMGSREIVVKSLGAQFSAVQGLGGATLMGDGSVVVILDPHALVRQEIAKSGLLEGATEAERQRLQAITEEPVRVSKVNTVMVVDDSVTVRKVTTRLLEREGFNAISAKDGVEALQVLQEETPDVMLLDIEMPRMDGFELAKNLRSSQRWKDLPIIMITSRTGDKHREHARSLGVNEYLGKPFQEEKLLGHIREFVESEATY